MFFFHQTVQRINGNFPILFDKTSEEDEYTEGTQNENDGSDSKINGFGIIPFVLKFCEVTNHNFEEALSYDISTLLYIVSYEVIKLKEQEKQIKKLRNGNH